MTSVRETLWDQAAELARGWLRGRLHYEPWERVAWVTRPVWGQVWEKTRELVQMQAHEALDREAEHDERL